MWVEREADSNSHQNDKIRTNYTPETTSLSSKVQQQSRGKYKPWEQNISEASEGSKKAYLMWVEREADSNWLLLLHPIQKKYFKILGALVRSQNQFQPTKWSDKGPQHGLKKKNLKGPLTFITLNDTTCHSPMVPNLVGFHYELKTDKTKLKGLIADYGIDSLAK